jgi:hypothetical protein
LIKSMSTTPRPVISEAVKGADKILHPSKFRMTSLDLGLKWRATTGSCGLWAAARACAEIPDRDPLDDTLTPAEDALMVMLLAGANPCRRNNLGELPMHWVESKRGTKILADLGGLETINAIDQHGKTPLHWAAEIGQTPKAQMLIRLGADLLKRDSDKNTPADVAKKFRHVDLYDILKWAQRKQMNNGGNNVALGGLLGETEMDRKATILRNDAEFIRWKRAKPCTLKKGTYDRATKLLYLPHLQRNKWYGPLPDKVDRPRDVIKELSRHMSYWTNEQVTLWISTEPTLINVLHDNSVDYNRRLKDCNVLGEHLAYLHSNITGSNDPLTQLLGMLDFPPYEKKHIIKAITTILENQKGIAPKEYKEAMEAGLHITDLLKKGQLGDAMLRREGQRQYDYHIFKLPIAIGKRSSFKLIGSLDVTPLTSMSTAWENIQNNKFMNNEINKTIKILFKCNCGSFWFCTPRDNRRLCLVSTSNDDKSENNQSSNNNKLSGKQMEDLKQYEKMTDSIYAHVYPLLLICPAEQEVLRGVEWTGTRMCRQWINPKKLKEADDAWKLAHRYKIEGFESKKRWVEEEQKGLDRKIAELEAGKKKSNTGGSGSKKWS